MVPIAARYAANRPRFARQLAATRIHDLLASHAATCPDTEATVDGDIRLTYSALLQRVDALAAALIAAGVGPDDRVATLTPPALDFWLTYLAVTSIGATWMGLNPRYQTPEYAYLLGDAEPALVFCRQSYEGRDYVADLRSVAAPGTRFVALGPAAPGADSLDDFLAGGSTVDPADVAERRRAVDPEAIAVIVYTSGTTGKPKGAMLSHRAILAAALTNLCWMGDGLDSTICAAPINHVGALNNVCMNVFAAAGRIIFYHRVDLTALAALARAEHPTYLVGSPTTFAMFAASPAHALDRMGATKLLVFGGGATAAALLAPVAATGLPMFNVYGQTETCGIVTATDAGAPVEIMADTIGRPLPGAEMRIGDAEGQPLPIGETGEIQVRGPYCMSGYFRRPEASAEAFTPDGYLRTGDLGIERPDGNFAFVGRLKEMYKSGGYNIYPVEIELALAEHPAVELAAVLPVPHPLYQEVGHAFIATSDPNLTADDLREHLRPRLANYKLPKSFSLAAALPLLPNYKVDKQALKRQLAEGVAA